MSVLVLVTLTSGSMARLNFTSPQRQLPCVITTDEPVPGSHLGKCLSLGACQRAAQSSSFRARSPSLYRVVVERAGDDNATRLKPMTGYLMLPEHLLVASTSTSLRFATRKSYSCMEYLTSGSDGDTHSSFGRSIQVDLFPDVPEYVSPRLHD